MVIGEDEKVQVPLLKDEFSGYREKGGGGGGGGGRRNGKTSRLTNFTPTSSRRPSGSHKTRSSPRLVFQWRSPSRRTPRRCGDDGGTGRNERVTKNAIREV